MTAPMARSPKTSKASTENDRVVATNRQARRNYEVVDTVEAGIMLKGSEVKAMRESQVQIAEAFARLDDRGEVWLNGMHVADYSHSGAADRHVNDRNRKLLLNRHEIERWRPRVEQEHLSLVPLSVYFKDGRVKVELALARGRKNYDKRQVIAQRDADRDAARAMSHRGRGDHG